MMNKYIIELLKTHTRVIIPDFGTFIVKVTEAPDGGEGTRLISFNDFLKFNDGVLINHIIKTESVNKAEAVKKIKEYIKTIEQEFRKSNKYVIPDLGELSKDNRGGINFSEIGEKKEKVEAKKSDKKKIEEPKKEEIKKEPLIKKEPIAKPAPKVEKKVAAPQNKQVSTTAKKKNIILPVAIIVVLVAAIAWSVYYFDVIHTINNKYFAKTENKIVKVEKQKSEKTIEAIIDSEETTDTTVSAVEEENVEKKETKPVEKKQTKKVQKFNVRKYYLVAGSFNIEANAKSFIDKLTSKGFTPEYIGERNGFYTVCYSSFDTEREAYNELERMKQKQILTWVLHY